MPHPAPPASRGKGPITSSRKNGPNATPKAPSRRNRARQAWLWNPERPASRSRQIAQQVACRSGALVILVVGTVGVLVGSHHAGPPHQARSDLLADQHQLTAQVATQASPVEAPVPPQSGSSVASTATLGASQATASSATSPASGTVAVVAAQTQKGPRITTIASWYGGRPLECWNGGVPMALPANLKMWAASRTLPCGTTIEVSGPAGTAVLLIEDHGPYLHPGRDLDLSPQAFRRVAGPLAKGLVQVQYRLAPGATPSP